MDLIILIFVALAGIFFLSIIISWILCRIKGTTLDKVNIDMETASGQVPISEKIAVLTELYERKEKIIRKYLDFVKGKTEILDTMECLEERPLKYQAMAALLSPRDILTLDIVTDKTTKEKRVRVLIDGIYPIGYLSILAGIAVQRNFNILDMAIVYSRSEDFPPEIEIGIGFRKPIEVK